MKALLMSLVCLIWVSSYGQNPNCTDFITSNRTIGASQYVKTSVVRLIVRSNYSYSMSFMSDDIGLFVVVQTFNGGILNVNDEIIFINQSNERRRFRFAQSGKIVTVNGSPMYENALQIDYESAKWLAKSKIAVFYVVNQLSNRMRKLSLQQVPQQDLLSAAQCFVNNLKSALVKESPVLVVAEPSRGPKSITELPSFTAPGSSTSDPEVKALSKDLDDVKTRLRAEIALEESRARQVKLQLQQEVQLAQESADLAKEQYAKEVLEARKRSRNEIDQVVEETQHMVVATRERASAVVSAYHQDVDSARAHAILEIREARLKSANEVAEIRKKANEEIGRLNANIAEVRVAYSDEMATARQNAALEITQIRAQTALEIKRANDAVDESRQFTAEEVQNAREQSGDEVLRVQEKLAQDIGKLRQDAALERERIAVNVAELHRGYAEESTLVAQSHGAELQEMKEQFVMEKTRQIESMAETRRLIGEEIASLRELQREDKAAIRLSMSELRLAYADTIKKAYELKDEQLDKITYELTLQRSKSDQMIDSIRQMAVDQVIAMRKAQHDEKLKIQAERDSIRTVISDEKRTAAVILQQERARLDSLLRAVNQDAVTEVAAIRERSQEAIKSSESTVTDILAEHGVALSSAQSDYAIDVREARERAMARIDQIEGDLKARVAQLNESYNSRLEENTKSLAEVRESAREAILNAEILAQEKLAEIARKLAIAEEEVDVRIAGAREGAAKALADFTSTDLQRRQRMTLKTESAIDSMNRSVYETKKKTAEEVDKIRREGLIAIENAKNEVSEEMIHSTEAIAKARGDSGESIRIAKERATEEIAAIQRAAITEYVTQQEYRDSLNTMFRGEIAAANASKARLLDSIQKGARDEIMEIVRLTNEKKHVYINDAEEVRIAANKEVGTVRQQLANDVYEAQKEAAAQITEVKIKTAEQIRNIVTQVQLETAKLEELRKQIKLLEKELEDMQGKKKKDG